MSDWFPVFEFLKVKKSWTTEVLNKQLPLIYTRTIFLEGNNIRSYKTYLVWYLTCENEVVQQVIYKKSI